VACRNPLLLEERRRKRNEMLAATEKKLELGASAQAPFARQRQDRNAGWTCPGTYEDGQAFQGRVHRRQLPLRTQARRHRQEAALDGIYIIRTSLPKRELDAESVVRAYKELANVERAFRSTKTIDLKIRPVFHYTADRVRAHVFLCMLAYYVEWHMREALAPMLFGEDDPDAAALERQSIVAPATPSAAAVAKARTKRTADGQPAHSFRTLLLDLATIAHNRVRTGADNDSPTFTVITTPTTLQLRALSLLGVGLGL
jgi:hypothetical protein